MRTIVTMFLLFAFFVVFYTVHIFNGTMQDSKSTESNVQTYISTKNVSDGS